MATGRSGHTATLLLNGKVLVAGGMADFASTLSSAELYDPSTNTWSAAASMATARGNHTATLLSNGNVLVTGGWYKAMPVASAELYHPATNTWSLASSMAVPRAHHTATLLPNGKVLVTGGWNNGSPLASAELYDPATNTWSAAASMAVLRGAHTATLLSNGTVLVTGGDGGGGPVDFLSSAELYNPATNYWSAAAGMASSRRSHSATLLANGNVLVLGGETTAGDPMGGGYTFARSAELYNPTTNTWSAAANMPFGWSGHTATALLDETVLVTGSDAKAELYNPATDQWSAAGSMATGGVGHTATLLRDGRVLTTGNWNNGSPLGSAELYAPAAARGAGTKLPSTGTGAGVPHGNLLVLLLSVSLLVAGAMLLKAAYRVLLMSDAGR